MVVVPPPSTEAANSEVAAQLAELHQLDQGIRARVAQLGVEHGLPLPEPFLDEWRQVDAENLRALRRIVDQHGWPSESLAGTQGALAAFLVVQHADLESQREFLPILQAAADRGEMSRSQLAYLIDRVRVREGRPQVYGTQVSMGADGRPIAEDLEEPEGVEARRAAVGLPPLEAYLRLMAQSMQSRQPAAATVPTNPALREELKAMHAEFRAIGPPKFGDGVTGDESTWPEEDRRRRAAGRSRVEALLTRALEEGYPSAAMVGEDGTRAFFLLAAEAELEVQERALPALRQAADRGEASLAHMAWLTDRVRSRRGEPQVYGTQFHRNAGGAVVPFPIADEAGIDERRASVGLPPLGQTLDVLNNRVGQPTEPALKIMR